MTPGTYNLDCKDNVDTSRIRLPGGDSSRDLADFGGGGPAPPRGTIPHRAAAGGGPLGLREGEACFYKSSTHGWITAQAVRYRPEDSTYDLDVKQQVPAHNIFCICEGERVEYHSASSGSWIPAQVVRSAADGTFDLDCKEGVHISRVRPPQDHQPAAAPSPSHGSRRSGGGYGGGGLAPLPEQDVYNCSESAEDFAHKEYKLEQLRQAMQSESPDAIKRRLESTSALQLVGEEALDQAAHQAWALEARPAAQAELRRAVAAGRSADEVEAALEAAVATGVSAAELEAGRRALKALRSSPLWQYDAGDGHHIDVRAGPQIDGPRVRVRLECGDVFCVSEERKGPDGVTYLQLADGRGWLFDRKPGFGPMCKRYVVRGPDSPGTYVVIHQNTAVTPTDALGGDDDIIGKLAAGAIVNVVQVANNMGAHRIRGRLEHPLGWISLLDTETGKRWAVKK